MSGKVLAKPVQSGFRSRLLRGRVGMSGADPSSKISVGDPAAAG